MTQNKINIKVTLNYLDYNFLQNNLIYKNDKITAQLILAPELEPVFLELTRKAKINTTLLYNDISE